MVLLLRWVGLTLLLASLAVQAQSPAVPSQANAPNNNSQPEAGPDGPSLTGLTGKATDEARAEAAVPAPVDDSISPLDPTPRRIVDPSKFPLKPSLPSRILRAPFRALAPKVNRGLTYYVEERQFLTHLQRILSHPHIRPRFGNLDDGSGFGGGVELSTANRLSENFNLYFTTHGTSKRYLEATTGFQLDPFGRAHRTFSLNLAARYRLRPQEDFYGLGPHSQRDDRTNYDIQERGLGLTASARVTKRLRVGATLDYSSSSVHAGKDRRFAPTQKLFNGAPLPGLTDGAALVGLGAFVEYESRDEIGNPHRGAYLRFAATSNDSVGRGDFGFLNYQVDARSYIPLGTERRVLALRVVGNFNDRKGNSEIPFFRLARLGDSQTLRGYDSYRFHGRNALAANLEYRYELTKGIGAFFFTDLGQVFDARSQFTGKNLHATFGGGLHFYSKQSSFLRVFVGKGGEGSRFFFSIGPSF